MTTAQPDDFITGVRDDWHAIEVRTGWPGCTSHRWSVCEQTVREALDERGRTQPYDASAFPVSLDPCPACRWIVAARTGTLDAALASLSDPLAHDVAAAILAELARDEQEADDPRAMQLLAAVSAHAPVHLVAEGCNDLDCEHEGECPSAPACRACSLQAGSWAGGDFEGRYMAECTITSPCAVLVALAGYYEVPVPAAKAVA